MDANRVTILIEAVTSGSMSLAAQRLGYTPSGVAKAIDALEDELGVKLVRRSSRGVKPTPEGRQLMPTLRELVHASERARQTAAELRGIIAGSVVVGTYSSIAAVWLPKVLRSFEVDYPDITVSLREGGNESLLRWVEGGEVDCALMSRRSFTGDWVELYEDRLMAWLPTSHPHARDALPIKELDGAPLIETSPHQDTDLFRLIEAEHVRPVVRYTTASSYTTYRMVEAGLGISIENELMSEGLRGQVAVVPFEPARTISLGVAIRSMADATPSTRRFIACVRRFLASRA